MPLISFSVQYQPAVGIVLIDEKGTETKLPMDMIAINTPSDVLVLLPADLKDGT